MIIQKGIAHFILDMGNGGAEKLVRVLSQKLQIRGFSNEVVCFDNINDYSKEFADVCIPLTLIKRKPTIIDLTILPCLVRRMKKNRVKLIHAHDLSSLSYAVLAGRMIGAKVVMTEHSRHYIDEKLIRRIEKWCLVTASSKLIEVSPELKKNSIQKDKIPRSKVVVIENGVDLGLFETCRNSGLRKSLGIPPDEKAMLAVGRLEVIKGQQYLIRALAIVRGQHKKCHLILAGSGGNKHNLEQLAVQLGVKENVHFLGTRRDIPQVMKNCDFLVLPSESEGLPFVVLEAMASRLPIIATKVGRIPEIIGSNERGFLVPSGDVENLSKAILLFLEKERLDLSNHAFCYVKKQYNENNMIELYRRQYSLLLENQRL